MLLIYIAGPYTHPDPCVNTRNAVLVAEEILKKGHIPYIPHLSHLWHIICPHPQQFWYDYDVIWLEKCDALFRMEGASKGADFEVLMMWSKFKKPVFNSLEEIPNVTDLDKLV